MIYSGSSRFFRDYTYTNDMIETYDLNTVEIVYNDIGYNDEPDITTE